MSEDEVQLELRLLESGDRVTGLSIGDKEFLPLKTFLQKHAKAFQQQSLARTYVVVDPARNSKIVAFITLISGEVQTDKEHALIDGDLGYTYTAYPAIKVARLAVVSNYRRSAIGRTLIDFALGTSNREFAQLLDVALLWSTRKRPLYHSTIVAALRC